MAQALEAAQVDHLVATGDITDRGRLPELRVFERHFARWLDRGRLTVVPGNHDRLGDDVGSELMSPSRVQVETAGGLYLVRLDSTGPHNRSPLASRGELSPSDLDEVAAAFRQAPARCLRVLLLHHHPLALPADNPLERLLERLGWRDFRELAAGRRLLERLEGHCDLVLHGHRHVPSEARFRHGGDRQLRLFNAGSSTLLGRLRMFRHQHGALLGQPRWLLTGTPTGKPSPLIGRASAGFPGGGTEVQGA